MKQNENLLTSSSAEVEETWPLGLVQWHLLRFLPGKVSVELRCLNVVSEELPP